MSKKMLFLALGLMWAIAAATESVSLRPGRPAEPRDFVRRGTAVGPSGIGLPKGRGASTQGKIIYLERCAACHGLRGEGSTWFPALVGGRGTLESDDPVLTVGSYWPYATTVWDYINRAMPYANPGTLTEDEVYAVTAYILHLNDIVGADEEMNPVTLPLVKMPNRDGFIPDPRPDVQP